MSRSSIHLLLENSSNVDTEIASNLQSHRDFSHELHEGPDFVLIIVHAEVVDLVEVVHHMRVCDHFLFVETQLDTSPIRIGLELVFVNLCSTISENLLFLSFQKES